MKIPPHHPTRKDPLRPLLKIKPNLVKSPKKKVSMPRRKLRRQQARPKSLKSPRAVSRSQLELVQGQSRGKFQLYFS